MAVDADTVPGFTQGFLAGAYVAIGALFANIMEANFKQPVVPAGAETTLISGEPNLAGLSNLVGGAVFPVGLIAIFLTGANLYTGNCMYVVPAWINGTAPKARILCFLGLSWLCNFLGAMFVVYFLAYHGEFTAKDPVKAYVQPPPPHPPFPRPPRAACCLVPI